MQNNGTAAAEQAELDNHRATLARKHTALRRQLDKGVPRAQFQALHALLTLVATAQDVLAAPNGRGAV